MVVKSILSGFIKGVGYESGTLRIVLKTGKAYDYLDVSLEDYRLFMCDFGKVYNSVIKKKYEERPVAEEY